MPVRFVTVAVGLALCVAPIHAAEQGQLDASESLFTVLAAINAAGYDADIDSTANNPLREAVRRELAAKNIPCLPELKRFFEAHRQRDWAAELSQYVSFGLLVDGPPAFAPRLMRNEMPPDVTALEGFQPLLVRFYKEAGIESLWQKAQPAIDAALARYHAPVTQASVAGASRSMWICSALPTRFTCAATPTSTSSLSPPLLRLRSPRYGTLTCTFCWTR